MLRAVVIASVVTASGIAAAQPVDGPAPSVEARDDAAWRLYHDAFSALLRGERRRAAELASALQRDHAGHPAAVLVASSSLAVGPGMVDTPPRPAGEQPTSGARAELALFQTLHGLYVGAELCVLIECESPESVIGIVAVTGGAGAVISLNIGKLTSGQRALLNSGTVWGAVNAGLVLLANEPDDEKVIAGSLLAGQGGGLALGAALFALRPTAGQVALANSGGQWAGVLTALALVAAAPDASDRTTALAILAAADAGIAAGAYLGSRYPHVSRAQTLVIDAGGIVGAVGGGGASIILSGDEDSRATPALAAAGAAVGLATAAYFTRDWGDRDPDPGSGVRAVVLPASQGRGGLAGLAGTW